jgi:hypothetical protein
MPGENKTNNKIWRMRMCAAFVTVHSSAQALAGVFVAGSISLFDAGRRQRAVRGAVAANLGRSAQRWSGETSAAVGATSSPAMVRLGTRSARVRNQVE